MKYPMVHQDLGEAQRRARRLGLRVYKYSGSMDANADLIEVWFRVSRKKYDPKKPLFLTDLPNANPRVWKRQSAKG